MDCTGDSKLLEILESRETCRRKLQTGCGISLKREICVIVDEIERCWRSKENFDIRYEATELGICSSGFQSCFGIKFSDYAFFHPFWDGYVYSMTL